jgi:hypothetical protein
LPSVHIGMRPMHASQIWIPGAVVNLTNSAKEQKMLTQSTCSLLMAKTQGFYKVVRASAVTHRKLQISKVVTPPIPD